MSTINTITLSVISLYLFYRFGQHILLIFSNETQLLYHFFNELFCKKYLTNMQILTYAIVVRHLFYMQNICIDDNMMTYLYFVCI